MTWAIIADSSCDSDLSKLESPDVYCGMVPFTLTIGGIDFRDTDDLDVPAMIDVMEATHEAGKSACPSPGAWCEQFERGDQVFALTISANLSGSHDSAVSAREMVLRSNPDKKVFVLDTRSTGPALAMCAEKIAAWIEEGLDFESIVHKAQAFCDGLHTVFALSSFGNLVKNGRVPRFTGFAAGKLKIWAIGVGNEEGKIAMRGIARNRSKVIDSLIKEMKDNGFSGGRAVISHCQNLALAEALKERIVGTWHAADVGILSTRGLCSFYAERRGLIVSY